VSEQPYERITGTVSEHTGGRPLTPDEATALLRLARRVAHVSDDRRAAPLVCYLAGEALAGEPDEAARLARIREIEALFPEPG
jgi:hypothetical protein